MEKGIGAVLINIDGQAFDEDGGVDVDVVYASHKDEFNMLPYAAIEMVETYDAATQVVIVFQRSDGSVTCSKFEARNSMSPIDAYTLQREGQVDLNPGDAVRLKEAIGDVKPGVYVFLRQEGAMMKFVIAHQVAEKKVVETDEEVAVHADFRDCFERIYTIHDPQEDWKWQGPLN
ncbi:MAG: hypothetical protein C0404_02285 [Verrucomicrobia bacterium]|nr:hypothetical protein [Verrucomicrobiota bacterium]